MSNKIFQNVGLIFSTVVIVLLGMMVLPGLNQYIQQRYLPVTDYIGEVTKRVGTDVYIHVWGTKLRDCVAMKDTLNSYYIRSGVRVGISEERIEGDPSSRPVGLSDLGVFVLYGVPADASTVQMAIRHNCAGTEIPNIFVTVPLGVKNGTTK